LKHANAILVNDLAKLKRIKDIYSPRHNKNLNSGVKQIITETDGSMIPIIKHDTKVKDRRKKKTRSYQEARLCLSYEDGSVTPMYAATMSDVNITGKYMRQTAIQAGLGNNTVIHAVGDGAQWISKQVEYKFGDTKVNYLIDLYHMSEYLTAANAVLTTDERKQQYLIKRQIKLLKNNEYQKVLHYFEGYKDTHEDNPVKDCYRYMINRPEQFAYKDAIERGLPIGSGKVEGGHRHVIQARLKISGAAWAVENINPMLALRTNRINGQWDTYWNKIKNRHL